MDYDAFDKLLALCEARGVSSLRKHGEDVEVTFFPRHPVAVPRDENEEKPRQRKSLMDAALGPVFDAGKEK